MSDLPPIRHATDADGPAVAALIAAVFGEYADCLFLPEEFPELAAPAAHFTARGGRLFVTDGAGGAVVGTIGVVPGPRPGHCELFKVYVAKALRGTGLAQRLLAEAEAFARAAGARTLELWSDTRFATGHRFYAKHGFVRFPGLRAVHDASRSFEYHFRKDLAP